MRPVGARHQIFGVVIWSLLAVFAGNMAAFVFALRLDQSTQTAARGRVEYDMPASATR